MTSILAQNSRIATVAELNATFNLNGVKAEAKQDGQFIEIEVARADDTGVAEFLTRKSGFKVLD